MSVDSSNIEIAIHTMLAENNTVPMVVIRIVDRASGNDVLPYVATPQEARHLGHSLLEAAEAAEQDANTAIVMRSHKTSDELIAYLLTEIRKRRLKETEVL